MNQKNNRIEKIKKDIENNEIQLTPKPKTSCLKVKEANQWIDEAKRRPIPNMLFSEFWYENELCILFADTNLGKSILSVQIANSISKGEKIRGFKLESKPLTVLYLDFELSDKQFEKRCSDNYKHHFKFNDNFLRAELDPLVDLPKGTTIEEYVFESIIKEIEKNEVNVLIVDNLTYLSNENEKAKDALVLMKLLKKLCKEKQLSILVLSHTPKRDNTKPISKNDLSGSKMLMNFCDSSFAIGASSKDSSLRYIKQIKQRNTEHKYDTENVVVCNIENENNLLGFHFIDYDSEFEHLKYISNTDYESQNGLITELVSQGKSNVEIAKQFGLTEGAIRKRRKKLGI